MRKKLTKRILAMVTYLLLVFVTMPDMAVAKKDAGDESNLSITTWNTISILGDITRVPQCNELSWKVENANFLVASKTNSEKDKGFIVWTKEELNERAKADIIKAIVQTDPWAEFHKLDGNKLPVTFAYGDTSKLQEPLKNVVIKPDGNSILIQFAAEKIWTKYMYGNYIYRPMPAKAVITADKVLEGRELEEGRFEFQLKNENGDVIETVKNGADGTITFKTIEYTEAGTYEYTVNEVIANVPGYTYDTKVLKYTVVVEDKNGQLVPTVTAKDNITTFTNGYKPLPTTVTITAQKELKGSDGNNLELKEGQFQFQLKDEEGNLIDTVGNAADGSIIFSKIKFDRPGNYIYKVNEVNAGEEGYTYDNDVFSYEVEVWDEDGQLKAEVNEPDDTTFNNFYVLEDIPEEPIPLSAGGIIATKVLKGKKLEEGQFQFQLRDEEGNLIETVSNKADGKIVFSPIEYKKAGTYIYKVNEVDAGEEGYTYDNIVYLSIR